MPRTFYVYILTSRNNAALYTGITGNLAQRLEQHRLAKPGSFTAKYCITKLVHAEEFDNIHEAILREKQIKSWSRRKKNELIERSNPGWNEIKILG